MLEMFVFLGQIPGDPPESMKMCMFVIFVTMFDGSEILWSVPGRANANPVRHVGTKEAWGRLGEGQIDSRNRLGGEADPKVSQ